MKLTMKQKMNGSSRKSAIGNAVTILLGVVTIEYFNTNSIVVRGEIDGTFFNVHGKPKTEHTYDYDTDDYFAHDVPKMPVPHPTMPYPGMPYPTERPTERPTPRPTPQPTPRPTPVPTPLPTNRKTPEPTPHPTKPPYPTLPYYMYPKPVFFPTPEPTRIPTKNPTPEPTPIPTVHPTRAPTRNPTPSPSNGPTPNPTSSPSNSPTVSPTQEPSVAPSSVPTVSLEPSQSGEPSESPSESAEPSETPSISAEPSGSFEPSESPSESAEPSENPSVSLEPSESSEPSESPSSEPSSEPSVSPSASPTVTPNFMSLAGVVCSPANADHFRILCNVVQQLPDLAALLSTNRRRMLEADRNLQDDSKNFTVFAPSNKAFLGAEVSIDFESDNFTNDEKAVLEVVVQNHIIGDNAVITFDALDCDESYTTLGGENITIACKQNFKGDVVKSPLGSANPPDEVKLKPTIDARDRDIKASNGILHEINQLILFSP